MRVFDQQKPMAKVLFGLVAVVIFGLACSRSGSQSSSIPVATHPSIDKATPTALAPSTVVSAFPTDDILPTFAPVPAGTTPTPDAFRDPPEIRDWFETYVVSWGDSLSSIAWKFGIGSDQLRLENGINNPNLLSVGQVLSIPPPTPLPPSTSMKLIPDSELVYGPSIVYFQPWEASIAAGSELTKYREEVEGVELRGVEIVRKVAESYSVNPRVLLAALEYQSGWVSGLSRAPDYFDYPMGVFDPYRIGLHAQLAWTADRLNEGFYLWLAGWVGPYTFPDGRVVPPGQGINAGTAAIQYLFSLLYGVDDWRTVISEGELGYRRTFETMFGDPFAYAVDPVLPPDLQQPLLQLPFEDRKVWSFTGGPHSAWGGASAWAALDFAPPGEAVGCVTSNHWVTASAAGIVVRSEGGAVLQDLSIDGYEQTGWSLFYMHIAEHERVAAGTYLQAGDRIGHPSCEGGVSTGTHVHIARKYNGVWIAADSSIPFDLDGWISTGEDWQYDGLLTRGNQVVEACSCRADYNQIAR
jgi:LasA protease